VPVAGPACPAASCRGAGRPGTSGRPEPDQDRIAAMLCPECRARLAAQLAALPGLYAELERDLATSRAVGERVRGSGTPGIRLNEQAVDARADMRLILASWADLVAEGSGVAPPARTVPSMAAFLARHLDWLTAHPAAGDAAAEIAALAQAASTAARPSRWRRIQLGGCVVAGCDGQLTALVRDRDAPLPSAITCDTGADHTWPPELWHTLQARRAAGPNTGLTAEDIARTWRIPRGTVYWLASVHGWRRQRCGRRVHYAVADVVSTLSADQQFLVTAAEHSTPAQRRTGSG
jgi:hypothetical protein